MAKNNHSTLTLHGDFIRVLDYGVMLIGPSGIGKSELALNLIQRGHALIADDAVMFSSDNDGNIIGSCPHPLQNLLEIRELGILNIQHLFGAQAAIKQHALHLIIELTQPSTHSFSHSHLYGAYDTYALLSQDITRLKLTIAPHRNLALLVETAVKQIACPHPMPAVTFGAVKTYEEFYDC